MAIGHIKTVDHILADGTHLTDEEMSHHVISDDRAIMAVINFVRNHEQAAKQAAKERKKEG